MKKTNQRAPVLKPESLAGISRPGKGTLQKFLGIASLCWVSVFLLAHSETGTDIRYKFETHLNIMMRHELGRDPVLSPSVRIYGFSDQDSSVLNRTRLWHREWVAFLQKLDSRNPRVIFIDKVFGYSDSPGEDSEDQLAGLKALKTPLITGGFFSPEKIVFREAAPVIDYFQNHQENTSRGLIRYGPKEESPVFGRDNFKIYYSSAKSYQGYFQNHSYLNYNGSLRITPFNTFSDGVILPHAALLTAQSIRFTDGVVSVNGHEINPDAGGGLMINIFDPAVFYSTIRNFTSVEKTHLDIKAGDTVILLPEMFTGGTDFHNMPFGYLPGGFLMTSLINSVITGQWLRILPGHSLLYALMTLAGLLVASLASPIFFWVMFSSLSLAIMIMGIFCFAFYSVDFPWLFSVASFGLTSLMVFAYRSVYTEKIARLVNVINSQKEEISLRAQVLASKTADLNFILSNVDQGIFSITKNNVIHQEYSHYLEVILQIPEPSREKPSVLIYGQRKSRKAERINLDLCIKSILSGNRTDWEKQKSMLPVRVERNIQNKKKILQAEWRAFFNQDGTELEKLMVILNDVTHLHEEKMRMVERVKWKALTGMSNGIAHEINNPLAIIEGMSAHLALFVAQKNPDEKKINHLVSRIGISVERIKNIVLHLRSFSREVQNDLPQMYALGDIISELSEFCQKDLDAEGITLEIGKISPSLSLLCQKSILLQVFLILFSNARAALKMQEKKIIRLEFITREESVIIRISDTGPGIPMHVKEKVFDPFISGKPVGEGSGLGLFTARRAVESLGGSLRLLNQTQHTTFELDLPAGDAA